MKLLIRSLVVLLISISVVSAADTPAAQAVSVPRPSKLPAAARLRLAGSGVFVMQVDMASGKVTSVHVQKSTGQPLLDRSAIQAFQNWRFRPGTVRRVVAPITFTADQVVGRY